MTTEPGSAQDQSEIASQLNASLLGSVIAMMFLVRHLGVCMAERDDAMVRPCPGADTAEAGVCVHLPVSGSGAQTDSGSGYARC